MSTESTTILIIEDELVIRDSMAEYLEDRDYTVFRAENGRIGLDIFGRERPDLILTDLRMPEVGGLEVLQKVSEISPNTPLVVISGTGNIKDSIQALRFGAWDYILKPVEEMSIITVAIEKALERARLQRENSEYQENLETLVHERTRELEEANGHLTDINTRLRKIVNTAKRLSLCEDVMRFGSTLLNEFAGHMLASGGSLFLVEERGLRKLNTLESDHVPDFIPFPLRENSVLKRAIEGKKPLLIKNIEHETTVKSSGWNGYSDGSILAFPLPDETGRIMGVLTLHSKIQPPFVEQDREIGSILASYGCETLRAVQSSEAMRESENRQRIILDSLRIGVLVVAPEEHVVVDCNSEAAHLIGAPISEIIGKGCFQFFQQTKNELCQVPALDPMIDNAERVLLTISGSEIPILKTIVPIQLNGRTHYLESFIDISSQKEAEKEKERLKIQLTQAQKMEAIGTLAGGLAHDLNNALNGIFAPTSLLLRQIDSKKQIHAETLSKQLNRIHESGFRITDMVNRLMSVSQKPELSLTIVDLNNSLKHILKITNNTFDKSIEISPTLFDSPALVKADPTQIEQVLLNLMINASHAMTIMRKEENQWGGKLNVGISKVQINNSFEHKLPDTKEGLYWLITVSDTGIGIEKEELPQIFTPFFTKKGKGEGTGLGLAMVYNIITQHNGFINVDSKPTIGTTFEIYLPKHETSSQTIDIQKPRKTVWKGKGLVLIVDDEEILRSTAEEILRECGYKTITAEGGARAVDIFERRFQEIDLVVLDLIMPKMSGNVVYKKMRAIDSDIRVLLVSGFKKDHRINTALDMGVTGFLQKPYDLFTLSKAVKKCLT